MMNKSLCLFTETRLRLLIIVPNTQRSEIITDNYCKSGSGHFAFENKTNKKIKIVCIGLALNETLKFIALSAHALRRV